MHKETLDPSLSFLMNLVLQFIQPCTARIQIEIRHMAGLCNCRK